MVNMKRRLSSEMLPPAQRAKLQTDYEDLLNKYFEEKTPAGGTVAAADTVPAPETAPARGRGGRGARGAGRGAETDSEAAPSTAPARGRGARGGRGRGTRGAGGGGAAGSDPEVAIERREERQQKRIEQGIKQGQLTKDEEARLEKIEANIKSADAQFKSDGNLSKDEVKKLNDQLNDASEQIWAERHDENGKQAAVTRLGKDIFATDDITKKIESGTISTQEAHQFMQDFNHLVNMKRRLSAEKLSDPDRAKLQTDYNDLLNKYFEERTAATKP
jgi:hypothetical protein